MTRPWIPEVLSHTQQPALTCLICNSTIVFKLNKHELFIKQNCLMNNLRKVNLWEKSFTQIFVIQNSAPAKLTVNHN